MTERGEESLCTRVLIRIYICGYVWVECEEVNTPAADV